MVHEARHNGVLVARHEDREHLAKHVVGHLDEGLEISEGRPFELHAQGDGADAIIDSFSSLEEAKEKQRFYSSPQLHEDGSVRREARFPKAEVRTSDGTVVWPPAPAPAADPLTTLDEPLVEPSASEATTEPAPPES